MLILRFLKVWLYINIKDQFILKMRFFNSDISAYLAKVFVKITV